MSEAMKQAFGLVRRLWGVFYLKHKITGQQTSLKTSDRFEAQRILQAHNESECQPHFNLSLARVYLNGADPKLATRTWREVMEDIVAKKKDETRRRWETAIKDRNFDCVRNLRVAETRPEHFDRALADGKVSTNVYLRRIHNHALGMEWLLKSVIPRLQWPRPVFKAKRAITAEEHAAIVQREQNAERRDFYELLWHTRSAPKLPCRRWMIGKRIGRKMHNGARNRSCCRLISGRQLSLPRKRIEMTSVDERELTLAHYQRTIAARQLNETATSTRRGFRLSGNRYERERQPPSVEAPLPVQQQSSELHEGQSARAAWCLQRVP
jgi:hypothetical protein